MNKYFGLNLEFDHQILENTVEDIANQGKGYVCFIDSTLLVESYLNTEIRNVLNSSTLNSCDGSYIGILASKLYTKKLISYNGPQFFENYITKPGIHCIIGNTSIAFQKIVEKTNSTNIVHLPLPFCNVEEFDYMEIGRKLDLIKPNYIWISLGAPKQEIFMNKLLPYLSKGVMLGVGAAINYFSGEVKKIPHWAKVFHLIWLYRIITEPKKQLKRSLKILRYLPIIYLNERNLRNCE